MKPKRFVTLASFVSLTIVLSVSCLPDASGSSIVAYEKAYSIANVVNDSDLVVFGRVIKKEFVFREDVLGQFTTDITIDVREMIKGAPNAGEDRVKFMIEGGTGTHPKTGEDVTLMVTSTAEFELRERVLLFLVKSRRSASRIPHGGYHVFRSTYGKRLIERNRVSFLYTLDNGDIKGTSLPLDLVLQIAKAAAKDYEAASRLENDIRAHIIFFEKLSDRLKREAQQIIDGEPQDQE